VDTQREKGLMKQHEAFELLAKVCFDYMGAIQESLHRKRFVLVAVDVFSRFIDLEATSDQTAEGFARYLSSFCGRFGIPKVIVTDNARTFDNVNVRRLLELFNIPHIFAAPHHSRGNAVAERAIQNVQNKINTLILDPVNALGWEAALLTVALSINTRASTTTKVPPYDLMFGRAHRPLQRSLDVITPTDVHSSVVTQNFDQLRADAIAASSNAYNKSKERFDRTQRTATFAVGEKVLVKNRERRAKLSPLFIGPFTIVEMQGDIFKLKRDNSPRLLVRHISHLKPYFHTPINMAGNIKSILMIMIAIVVIVCKTNKVESILPSTLPKFDPIWWTASKEHITSLGTEKFLQELFLVSPCNILHRFHRALLLDPNTIRPKFSGVDVTRMMGKSKRQFQNNPPLRNGNVIKQSSNSEVDYPFEKCEFYFNRELATAMAKFSHEPTKQQFLPIMGGILLSNVISSIEDKLVGEPRYEAIKQKLNALNEQFNIMRMIHEIQGTKMKEIAAWINHISDSMNDMMIRQPELSVVASYLISKILQRTAQLERLHISIEQGRPDLVTLREILHTSKFGRLHPLSTTIQNIATFSHTHMSIVLNGEIQAPDPQILHIHSFTFVIKGMSNYIKHEYAGKLWVLQNQTADCVSGIEPTTRTFITNRCETAGYKDPRLKSWRKTNITKLDDLATQYYDEYPNTRIYCYLENITISSQKSVITKQCPTYPFTLNQNYTFKTSANVISHSYTIKSKKTDKQLTVEKSVAEIHFEKPFDDGSEVWDKYDELIAAARENEKRFTAIKIGDEVVTWWHIAMSSLTVTASVLVVWCLMKV